MAFKVKNKAYIFRRYGIYDKPFLQKANTAKHYSAAKMPAGLEQQGIHNAICGYMAKRYNKTELRNTAYCLQIPFGSILQKIKKLHHQKKKQIMKKTGMLLFAPFSRLFFACIQVKELAVALSGSPDLCGEPLDAAGYGNPIYLLPNNRGQCTIVSNL